MKIHFRWKVTVICLSLAGVMLRLSYWQWNRYEEKQAYIARMHARLQDPVVELAHLVSSPSLDWSSLPYRRVHVKGRYDFEHEMALRNRRYGNIAGVHALTPLELDLPGNAPRIHVLVSRGFIPLSRSDREKRREFQREREADFVGLIKESVAAKFLAPKDPPAGPEFPWVDDWLRVNIPAIQRQLPYQVLPIYLEEMEHGDSKGVEEQILNAPSEREELLFLGDRSASLAQVQKEPDLPYPVPVYETVIPPGRHFGYIFEWAFMALATVLIGLVIQLRPGKRASGFL